MKTTNKPKIGDYLIPKAKASLPTAWFCKNKFRWRLIDIDYKRHDFSPFLIQDTKSKNVAWYPIQTIREFNIIKPTIASKILYDNKSK